MKKNYLLVCCLLAVMLFSCQKEEPISTGEMGSLSIKVGMSLTVKEVNEGLKAAPSLEDFKIFIYRGDGTEFLVFETLSLMPDTIKLEPGYYYVVAYSDNNLPAAFENPYYYGESEIFSITSNTEQSVEVICSLANTIVSVVYSENIINSFVDYNTIVSNELDSLVYSKDETRSGYFRTSPLDIHVDLTFLNPDGSFNLKTLTGSIPNPLQNRHYEIYVNASIDEGAGSFQILMDSTEIPIEQIEITDFVIDTSGTADPDEPVDTIQNQVAYGELLISEIMYDPSALSDTEGEWIEIYNNSDHTINLQNLVIERDATNRHTISDSIDLLPGDYLVLSRSNTSTDATTSYIYGSAITLPNTGAVLAIYNEGPASDPGTLIFAIDYGQADFPGGSGASVSLNPLVSDPVEATLGISWCLSVSIYGTGDLGTPGIVNDSCQ